MFQARFEPREEQKHRVSSRKSCVRAGFQAKMLLEEKCVTLRSLCEAGVEGDAFFIFGTWTLFVVSIYLLPHNI